jgi:hypothetical protein
LVRQWQSYYSNTNTRTGCWRSNSRTTKTDISVHLNKGFSFFFSLLFSFFSFSLNAYLVHCWLVHHLSLLISLNPFFFFFSFLLSFCSYSSILDIITFTTAS